MDTWAVLRSEEMLPTHTPRKLKPFWSVWTGDNETGARFALWHWIRQVEKDPALYSVLRLTHNGTPVDTVHLWKGRQKWQSTPAPATSGTNTKTPTPSAR